MKIPLYKPIVTSDEIDAVTAVLKSAKLSRGSQVELFESEFAQYVNKKHAIALNSGTSALHVSVKALGWGEGDEVITTPFSYVASSNALLFEGVTPIFVDIDPNTLNIDFSKIEEKITSRTKGILLVHVLGLPVDPTPYLRLKEKYNLEIIEDACEAIGKPSQQFPVGVCGDVVVYGFHENKQLTTAGEGGMIVTDNKSISNKCWAMRDQGRSPQKDWIRHVILGFNFRMTEAQAAFGRVQLKKIEDTLNKRQKVAQKYTNSLKKISPIQTPQTVDGISRSWFLYYVLFENEEVRNHVYEELKKAEIDSSMNYFPPIFNFPMYTHSRNTDCPITTDVSKRLLALPLFYEMTDVEVEQVVSVIKQSL